MKQLMKVNHAIAEGALKAGCKFFFGYPITPQNEVLERMAERLPEEGGTFLQAESEVSAANMVLGAAAAGGRVMTGSAGPGMDLYQEGLGNIVAHRFPCVIANIQRGGPGNGALHPAQQDYSPAIRGRGDISCLVLAPWNGQESYDLTRLAFPLAEKYRNPVMVLSDTVLGQMYEPIDLDEGPEDPQTVRPWAVTGRKGRARNLTIAHFPEYAVYDAFHRELQETYRAMRANEQRSMCYRTEDAEIIFVAYGIMARNALSAVKALRAEGVKAGLFRPITLFPYPENELRKYDRPEVKLLVAELSAGQMATDVRLICRRAPIALVPGQAVAQVPKPMQFVRWAHDFLEGKLAAWNCEA